MELKKNFFLDHTKYTEIDSADVKAAKGFRKVTNNHDVWLLQCPKGFDIQQLKGHKLKFNKRTKLKGYKATAHETQTPQKLAIGYVQKHKYKVKLLPIKGSIVLQERKTAIGNENEENSSEETPETAPAMPEIIKLRHPLFGADFDEYIKNPNQNSVINRHGSDKEIESRHSRKRRSVSVEEIDSSEQLNTTPKKKRKKHDVSEDEIL